jgi:peptidoglycan/LPS O-acetylase OafA/YrhL
VPSWPTWAQTARIACLGVLLITGAMGLVNHDELTLATTPLEHLIGAAVVGYGVTGLVTAFGVWARWTWAKHVVVVWAAAAVTAATAPTAWDRTTPWYATALSGLVAMMIVLPVVIQVRRGLSPTVRSVAGDITESS